MKHFGELFFFLVVIWFVWAVMGSTPHSRLRRACVPLAWSTDALTAFSRTTNSDYSNDLSLASHTLNYKCQMFLWNYFYRAQFLKEHPGVSKASADRYEVAHLYYVQHKPAAPSTTQNPSTPAS